MAQFRYKSAYSESINYHLENFNFDGPLDVLLDMIDDKKIEIKDLFISDITQQFLQYVKDLEKRDYAYISDFIKEAATLLYIKSTKFFPKEELDDGEFESFYTEEELYIMHLEEYKKLKEAAEKLKSREIMHRFYHEPMFTVDDYKLVIKGYDINKLIKAFKYMMENVIHREEITEPQKIVKERSTVAEITKEVAEIVRDVGEVKFYSLFALDYDKLDVLNTFLAILEILKQGVATAEILPDGDILLKHNPDDTGADVIYEEAVNDAQTVD